MGEAADILWATATVLAAEAANVRSRPDLPPLLFFTDPARTPRPWETAARLPAGAGVVYRGFGAPDAPEISRRLREVTRQAGVRLLIGLDVDLAQSVGADGVHLPERALDQAADIRRAHPDWLLTGATHSIEALARAGSLDAAVLSPVFPAGGASVAKAALGVREFSRLVALAPCPVYALGGIDRVNARDLIGSGACGLAGVSSIQAAFA